LHNQPAEIQIALEYGFNMGIAGVGFNINASNIFNEGIVENKKLLARLVPISCQFFCQSPSSWSSHNPTRLL
jgi:hypothetical protein